MVAVELAGVETECVSACGRVAGQALGAAGETPDLGASDAVLAYGEVLFGAFIGHESGLGLCFVPAIGHAIRGRRSFDQEARLDPA
jgi:hypothetical protein